MKRRVGQDLSQEKETAMNLPDKGWESQRSQAAGESRRYRESRRYGQKEGRALAFSQDGYSIRCSLRSRRGG